MVSGRPTYAPTTASLQGIPVTAAQFRLSEKQRELELFHRLRGEVGHMSANFEQLSSRLDTLADGGEVLERVVENWANVFRAVHLALASLSASGEVGSRDDLPEALVRLPSDRARPSEGTRVGLGATGRMATVKVFSLLVRTLAKPVSTQLKNYCAEHPTFKRVCISVAQNVHAWETRASSSLLGSSRKQVRPLSEAKAVSQGSTLVAEGFLFSIALLLIVGESFRGRMSASARRDSLQERLADMEERLQRAR